MLKIKFKTTGTLKRRITGSKPINPKSLKLLGFMTKENSERTWLIQHTVSSTITEIKTTYPSD